MKQPESSAADAPPQVTVLISIHNGAQFLRQSLESILAQELSDFEVVAIDDGSNDSTGEMLHAYACRDARLRVVCNERNLGLTVSLNRGMRLAMGEFVARADADDVYPPHRLSTQLAFMRANPGVALCGAGVRTIDAGGTARPTRPPGRCPLEWRLLWDNVIAHPTFFFRTDVVRSIGGYDESFAYAQDYDLLERLSQRHRLALLEDVLCDYRIHSTSIGSTKRPAQRACSDTTSARFISRYLGSPMEAKAMVDARTFMMGYSAVPASGAAAALEVVDAAVRVSALRFDRKTLSGIRRDCARATLQQAVYLSYVSWPTSVRLLMRGIRCRPAQLFSRDAMQQVARLVCWSWLRRLYRRRDL